MSDQSSSTSSNSSSSRRGIVITYAKALHLALLEVNEEGQDKVLENFAKEISQNGHAGLLLEIEKEFEALVEKSGTNQVEQKENKEYLEKLNKFAKKSANAWQQAGKQGGIAFRYDEE